MKFLNATFRLAEQSQHPRYPMASLVIRGGSVIAQSTNGPRTGRHAEILALSKDIDYNKASIITVRANGNHQSTPCRACFSLAKSLGIRKMFFYDETGEFTCIDTRYSEQNNFKDYGI